MRASPSSAQARAWALARREAARLVRGGARGVAVSGSLARGDFVPGSDVDLWCVGPRQGRTERVVGGLSVTVFHDGTRALADREWVARWDVEQLVVLVDLDGDFARLKRHVARHRRWYRGWIDRQTRLALADATRRLRSRSRPEALLARRELAWTRVADRLWRATGIRVPRWRHARAALSPARLAALARDLGLVDAADRARLLAPLVPRAPAWTEALVWDVFHQRVALPRWHGAEARLAGEGAEEAVLKVRAELERWVAQPLRDAFPVVDVARLLDDHAPAGLARLFRLAHGLPPTP